MPLPVALDLIRFEKNLLQIGFFGAHDTRHRNQSTRRIEQWVNRNGQKIKVAAEFRGSQELGLPSTSDRDKYIAFMKIAMEQKVRLGCLENPIRFTGYHMLKELGLTFSGENYEDINRWGQRMADASITSEQVIYLAARKKYANKTVHVFRSFTRSGQSNLDDSGRAEAYEVVLEDWLLENLNQSYVIPEDFTSYRRLKRPTAKGIFGYLHLWFHASHGRPIEKDYAELCMLLNIPVYRHVSKIRETMGRSLDELAGIEYLSGWDVRPMMSKPGYKLVLTPGSELLHVLAISQRKQLADCGATPELTAEQQAGLDALLERGISPAKAQALVRQYPAEAILDQVEYAEFLVARDRRRKISNPAGLIIYVVESQVPVPQDFPTSRRLREHESRVAERQEHEIRRMELQDRYEEFVAAEVDRAVRQQFPGPELKRKCRDVLLRRRRTDPEFAALSPIQQEPFAEQLLRREIREALLLPSFEEWCRQKDQLDLFQ
ncbi:MAG TPA: replication initiator protein A [Bryobacteraceae bacterium]|nr:replication initiator protein A [Bryobacteraceae bacterium]